MKDIKDVGDAGVLKCGPEDNPWLRFPFMKIRGMVSRLWSVGTGSVGIVGTMLR
jgi:hypothetical protein